MNSVVDKIRMVIAITLAFVMLTFGGAFTSLLSYDAYAAEESVTSWADLKDKIENDAQDGDVIVIAKDIVAEGETIVVEDKKITIKGGANGAKIMRKKGDSNFPLFTTQNGAELILGEKLTLTGQQREGECPPDSGFTVTYTNGAGKSDSKDIPAGQEVYINRPAADWTPENGYEFKGWKFKTSADGSAQSTSGNQNICSTGFNVPTDKVGEMKLVAEYQRENFVVTWSNGVSGDGEKTQVWDLYGVNGATKKSVGEGLSLTPPDDWKPEDGYVFAGWKYKLSDGTELTSSGDNKQNVVDGSSNPVKMAKTAAEMKIVAQWEKPASGGNMSGKFLSSAGYLRTDGYDIYVYNNARYASTIEFEAKDGKIFVKMNGKYLKAGQETDAISFTNSSNNAIHLTDAGGTPVSSFANNTSYFMKDGQFGYVYAYDGRLYANGNASQALSWSSSDATGGGGGDPTPYESQVDPVYAGHDPEAYPTTVQPTYSESDVSQGCDGNCKTYTKNDFASGSSDNPRGFFVQVVEGTVTLDGATLENFNTSTNKGETPKDVAPVVASGSKAKFIVKSGKIQNNIVGYLANDDKSTDGANAIKMYIKGAAPNARRKKAPEPADGTRRRRNSPAGIDGGDAGSGITGTAGAIIYANGAKGEISGGSIGYNRADTGGIMVTDENTLVEIKRGADIHHNVGVQFGGGVMVEQGGAVYMSDGEIHDNVAWFGGGAVFATENGIDWLRGEKSMSKDERKDGYFTMAGGKIYGNNAFTRGGGFLVDSNGVSLQAGEIYANTSRVLGGAAYVMGDHPDYSYTLYIEKGEIYNNEAVTAEQNEPTSGISTTPMSKKLNSAKDCKIPDSLFGSSMSGTSDDIADFQKINDGTGGGVWTCPYGSTVLDLDSSLVWIHGNEADGATGDPSRYTNSNKRLEDANKKNKAPAGGQDFHSDNGGDGTLLILNATPSDWKDENTGGTYTPGSVDAEIRNLTFQGSGTDNGGIKIYNNTSRRGGGLAADGTFVFGPRRDVARVTAELEISKVWEEGIEKKPVVIRVGVKSGDKEAIVEDLELDGKANSTDEESYHENAATDTEWSGGFNLPVSVDDENGNRITVFKLVGPDGTTYDPTNNDHMVALAAALKSSDGRGFKLSSDAKLTFTELVKVGENEYEETKEYYFEPGEVQISDLSITVNPVKRVNAQGEIVDVLEVSFTKVPLRAPLRNNAPEKPEIEKYVSQAVHDYIDLDEVFTYDILAYVTKDADKVMITDNLVEDLEFVDSDQIKVYDLGLDDDDKPIQSNHKPTNDVAGEKINDNASVAQDADEITGDGVSVETDGSLLTVTLDDEVDKETGDRTNHTVEKLRGHWVKVSFKAQIKQALQDDIKAGTMTLSELSNVKITENDPVDSEETHSGIDNKASYEIEVANESQYEDESNTVTVKPELPEIEKYVNKAVHKNIMLDEVFTYDIIGFITRDADEVVFEDQLVSDLEFTETDSIKVVALDENNHKPLNDINGSTITDNTDASVAESGTDITESVDVDTTNGKLTVTIDDEDTVKSLRGKYVKITFMAQIKKKLQDEINAGTKTLSDLSSVTIEDNGTVLSDEDHEGIKNEASMKIKVGNDWKYEPKSNTVTVKPEKPEIEKYINQAVHEEISLDDEFTYDVIAYVTNNADKFTVTDKLVSDLEFVSEASDVKVADLGTENNHKPTNDIEGKKVSNDATVAKTGTDITGKAKSVKIEGDDTLTVEFDDVVSVDDNGVITREKEDVMNLRGHWIKVTFKAQIKEEYREKIKSGEMSLSDLKYVTVKAKEKYKTESSIYEDDEERPAPNVGNAPVVSDEDHTGIENTASYVIEVVNSGEFKDESNTVTVRPNYPEIEKYVSQAVHDYIKLDEVFTYDVIAYVTNNADKVTISDNLVKDLEFADTESIKLYDLGTENNHKPVNNVEGMQVNDDATVAKNGTDITSKDGVEITAKNGKLKVVLDDGVSKITGERTYTTVKELRGHWVKVTFKAQIKKELQAKINAGEMTLSELSSVTIKKNNPVLSGEEHTGIDNKASYEIETANDGKYEDESNTVTVKPEKPEIEKFIDKVVHKDIHVDKVFTYDIIAYVTGDADKVTIKDKLVDDLEFVSEAETIKVVDLGEATAENVDHEPNGTAVTAKGTDITGGAVSKSIDNDGKNLTVTIDDGVTVADGVKSREYNTVKGLRGHWVKVTFEAKIEESKAERIKNGELAEKVLEYATIKHDEEEDRYQPNVGNDPVKTDEDHTGVKNTASYDIEINNTGEYTSEYEDTSNTVTVKPEQPEIEKYVNQAVHDFIKLDEVFTYDIIAYVTKDADKVVIRDVLDDQLQFESKESDVEVVDLGEDVNHKVTYDIKAEKVNNDASVAEKGKAIDNKTVTIEGNELTVTLVDETADDNTVKNLRGHWIKVTFDAKIKDGLSTVDLKYAEIDASAKEDRAEPNVGNNPVISDESHDGVPNKASYKIAVKNDAEAEGEKFKDKYEDESNTVTVKPEEFDVKISKTDLGGDELSGAKIEVKDKDGKVVDSWTSKDKPHELKLKPGEYTMVEVVAPKGFGRVTTEIKFTVDKDGKVKLGTTKVDNNGEIKLAEGEDNHLLLQDAPVLKITKTDLGGDELPGAKIEIRDENDKVVDTWTSDKKPHELTLKPGKYFLVEVNAPEGFNAVTTKIEFTIDAKGKVTLGTTTVNNGGKILVAEGEDNHLILQDAPKPTLSKTVNGGSEVDLTNPDEIFSYTITSKIAYVPDESFAIIDEVPPMLEIVNSEDIVITVNNEYLLSDDVAMILSIEGNTLTVAPTKEMMKEWGPFEIAVKFFCKVREGENIDGKSVKNVAMLEVDGEFIENGDGEDEATVHGVYDNDNEPETVLRPVDDTDDTPVAAKDRKTTKGAKTGDKTEVLFWITLLALSAGAGTAAVVRRRRSVR